MAKTKISKQPSHYPGAAFHGVRSILLISSTIVAAIIVFFISSLSRDSFGIPWTFIILLGASLLTDIFLVGTFVLHCCRSLKPIFNLVLNIVLLVFWSAGFGILAWATNATLSATCNADHWGNSTGIMVCNLYKALFSAALIALIFTTGAVVLDIYVYRQANSLGAYVPANNTKLDDLHKDTSYNGRRGSGGAWEIPRQNFTDSHDGPQQGIVERQPRFENSYADGGRH